MVYNFPTVTAGLDLDSDVLAALAAHPNIVGVKLSCGNVGKLHRLASSFPPSSFAVFPGTAAVLLPGLLCGGAGGIMALPNVVPRVHVRLLRLWEEGKMQEATALQAKLAHADWAVGKIGGVGGIKAIVAREWGYGAPWVRSPLAPGDATKLDADDPGNAALRELIAMEKGL
jgi:4-hydroxy-2-oxoglutarate aldolase